MYDVAVIGSGPGGGMAASRLAERGIRTIILEKEKLPRHKACGGAVPMRLTKLLSWDLESQIKAQVYEQIYLNDYQEQKSIPMRETPMLLVDRSEFDFHFVQRALEIGNVELREEFAVRSITENEDSVSVVNRDGETISARYVIGADGASSVVARSLGMGRAAGTGAAIDVEIEVSPDVYERESGRATFNLFCVPNGYGWIFPKNGYLSCGVGAWRKVSQLQKQMDNFLERSFAEGVIQSVKRYAHPVPVFPGHHDIATKRVCLVGDAAQLVDSVLGEGIYYAVKSGALAAEVMANLLDGTTQEPNFSEELMLGTGLTASQTVLLFDDGADCSVYQKLVRRGIARELNTRRLTSMMFFHNPQKFYNNFTSSISY